MYLGAKPDHSVFAKWAKKRDIFLNPDVAFLVPTKSMGLGVYALRPLKKGSTILSCPISSAISPYETASIESPSVAALAQAAGTVAVPSGSGSSSSSAHVEAKGHRTITTTLHICLRLMAELARPQSPMRPWLECCPKMAVHLFSISDAQREAMFGSGGAVPRYGWSNVGQQLDDVDVDGLWAAARRVMDTRPDVWPPATCTRGLLVECLTQVLSRNFHREEIRGQEGPYLLPGVDFINHSFSHANAAFTMRGGGRAHALCFEVMALRDIAKGEQVYYQYGPISEARFFVEFQFLNAEANPYDGLRFSAATLVSMGEATIASLANEGGATIRPHGNEYGAAASPYHLRLRVEELQRMSILGDEGLWVPQVVPSSTAAAATARHEGHLPLVKGVAGELWNVVYLLTCVDDKAFDNLSLKLSRHWECPKGALVTTHLIRFLQLRLDAVQQSLGAASAMTDLLCEDAKAAATTKGLLVKALQQEVGILQRMMDRINGKEDPDEEEE